MIDTEVPRPFGGPLLGALYAFVILLAGQPAWAQRCTILDDCTGIDSLPTADVCEEDDCSCAQQIECYLRGLDPATNWPVLPGGEVKLNRNFFHDRFVETRISPGALEAWLRFAEPSSGPVSLPDQTVVYKSGYLPSDDDPAVPDTPALSAYVMVKLDGYCPDGSSVGDFCLGGDWFAFEVANATYGILASGQIPDDGKSTTCFGCHAAAERADWLWQLYSRRRYP
jgi:hypothetical protein